MTHASVELIDAMLGVAPAIPSFKSACGLDTWAHHAVWAEIGGADDSGVVDCHRCLVAMDAAREVRAL